jgi:predicted phage terminase large subunit-like protein
MTEVMNDQKFDETMLQWAQQNPKLVLDELLKSNFRFFVQKSFQTLNPGTPYLHNWHIDAIAWHLEQVRLGAIKRLIINMPPRSAKSISASVAFPAFVHAHNPTTKIIAVSYAQNLATKLHNDYRSIVSSAWYRNLFPDTRIDPKKDTEQEVRLTARGNRFATSVGGVITGRGGDIIVIDDPLKPEEAMSDARRTAVNDWYSGTLLSRLNQKKHGAIVIVTQRLHVDDLVGHVTQIDDHGWTILNLPAIAPEDQVIPTGKGLAHGRMKGDLLHPEREDQTVLDELRASIGSATFEAQYQQQPVPPSGNMFKRDWLSSYPYLPEVTEDDTIFQSWDTASKTGPENDWSVGTTWLHSNGLYYLIDVYREKLNYPDLKAKMINKAQEYDPRVVLIEDAGVGTGLLEDLRREGIDAVAVSATKDKVTRAHIQTPKFESRRVLFPNFAPWLSALEAELLAFPSGRHDDQVDSITQALAYDVPVGPGVVYIRF